MKFIFGILPLMMSFGALGQGHKLSCVASFNSEKVLESTFTLSPKERNKSFGEIDGFEFLVSENSENVIELQAYNMMEPSRSYATANLSQASSFVELSIWKREFLMEVKCTKVL